MPLPSVFAYLDYRVYLRDWFDARKRLDADYSFSAFSRDAGCSKAALANVIGGARAPRAATLDAFAQAMELTPHERNYLGLLVELAGAPDLAQRRATMDKLLSTEQYRKLRLAETNGDADAFRFLEFWYIPAIRELAGIPGFKDDPEWIATTLTPNIRVTEAEAALETLFDLGFLVRDPDGAIQQRAIRFRTAPVGLQDAAIHFHREMIPTLMRSIETKERPNQHLLTTTVALDASMLPEAKARLDALIDELTSMAEDARAQEGKRIYQVGIQLLPISAELG